MLYIYTHTDHRLCHLLSSSIRRQWETIRAKPNWLTGSPSHIAPEEIAVRFYLPRESSCQRHLCFMSQRWLLIQQRESVLTREGCTFRFNIFKLFSAVLIVKSAVITKWLLAWVATVKTRFLWLSYVHVRIQTTKKNTNNHLKISCDQHQDRSN